ncbi:E3 ubiquitin-protein ligase RNF181-like [Phymastichus coffea]|uniref:E3 ubiquitin-protein ligase RNF181-like n=1 Tax=Phymastichus coffea TaxID=108790 RepID=UPI00273B364E|nr:E3 ubiquitin-protein ligase RNF181-like [Phymastichus coffea]XP_058809100.1 E3 ubiquitin-protein ligase RNF181-like [Phymastichus coffea]
MADYFQEMGWVPLAEFEGPNHLVQMARFLRDSGMWDLLDNHERLPPPASKEAVKNLEEVEHKNEAGAKEQCPVCLIDFEKGIISKRMPCKHSFHKECIEPWLEKTNSCPVCRHELPTDDENYENYRKEKKRAVEREKDLEALHDSMFS